MTDAQAAASGVILWRLQGIYICVAIAHPQYAKKKFIQSPSILQKLIFGISGISVNHVMTSFSSILKPGDIACPLILHSILT
jgi:hypothetical protein